MREARTQVGLLPDGETLMTYRIKKVEGQESFGSWKDCDPLPPFQDHVTGFTIVSPPDTTSHNTPERPEDWPRYKPSHPAFGMPSVVDVLRPLWMDKIDGQLGGNGFDEVNGENEDCNDSGEDEPSLKNNASAERSKALCTSHSWAYHPPSC